MKYYYCNKLWHYQRDCYRLKNEGEANNNPSNVATVVEENYNVAENVLYMTVANAQPRDEWILNLGCSYRICPNRDKFTTYQSVNDGTILIGKNIQL